MSVTFMPRNDKRPTLIGLYGLPGSGKSFLLDKLRGFNGDDAKDFIIFDEKQVIETVLPSARIADFDNWADVPRANHRKRGLEQIQTDSYENGKGAVIAGNGKLWDGDDHYRTMISTHDFKAFTHIVYLEVPAAATHAQRLADRKVRPLASVNHLQKWQEADIVYVADQCKRHSIIFTKISAHTSIHKLFWMFHDFRRHTQEYNAQLAEQRMERALSARPSRKLDPVLVLDGDRILAPINTRDMFMKRIHRGRGPGKENYSYEAKRQETILCEELVPDTGYRAICEEIAKEIRIRGDFARLLHNVKVYQRHVRVLVLTCGLREVWKLVFEKAGFGDTVDIIGGGRLSDGLVMTPELKERLVKYLRVQMERFVWAFGSKTQDLGMMIASNQPIVVCCKEFSNTDLATYVSQRVETHRFRPWQVVLPGASPLSGSQIPVLSLEKLVALEFI
ncbi:hypothetical protein N7466_002706 [Penicillium verhagenii]|uniref:uncharacterized protein n=1 Tax=Penicillium verhagenii TaxID=1562060 RepID=UPI002545974B|nr:uncharacterized protein N7466_002706 [Penicillium verhagenii]KAJ5939572.1 hypothetical protein N7466_002706 [Penicillium verhagenii]